MHFVLVCPQCYIDAHRQKIHKPDNENMYTFRSSHVQDKSNTSSNADAEGIKQCGVFLCNSSKILFEEWTQCLISILR